MKPLVFEQDVERARRVETWTDRENREAIERWVRGEGWGS